MSPVARSLSLVNPWADVAARPDITIEFADLPGRIRGFCDHDTRTIWISTRLRQRERNKVLQHELLHMDRGPVFACHQAEEERAVEEATARILIPIDALCDALRWSRDPHDIADALHVPAYLIRIRWDAMKHPAERAAVAAVMADLEDMAVA
jgi:hypothetical protein